MSVIDEIAAERRRQIEQEGWTPEHDDGHNLEELALVAALFATPIILVAEERHVQSTVYQDAWPDTWDEHWDKRPKDEWEQLLPNSTLSAEDRRRQLVISAALIVAEIERMDRRDTRSR